MRFLRREHAIKSLAATMGVAETQIAPWRSSGYGKLGELFFASPIKSSSRATDVAGK
jgi:hypothetical protein